MPRPEPGRRPVVVIELNGLIRAAQVQEVRNALANVDRERVPAGAIFILDSKGGDGLAAIEIGRMAHAAKAHAFVRGRCASACLFIFAGSMVRAAPDGAVGIHRARITRQVKGVGEVNVDLASTPRAAEFLEDTNRRMQAYLEEIGMPNTLFEAMMSVPPNRTRFLTRRELAEFGLLPDSGSQAKALAAQDRCAPATASAAQFARCYRLVAVPG
ncbi:MAG: hypothetical protein HY017_06805 [Betaproteobacteria bacterium]|nr:hypothetical protein [Betaproteobacteria bacterium]